MKRSTFLGAVVLLLAAVVSQSGSPVSVAAADTAPYYDQQPGINECTYTGSSVDTFPCYATEAQTTDAYSMRLGECTNAITNFCYTATVDNQSLPSGLNFMVTVSAYKTHTSSVGIGGYETYVNAYYVAPGDTFSSRQLPFGSSDRPRDQTEGDGKVDLTPANIDGKVIKVVAKYKTLGMPQYSVVVADEGLMDFGLVGQDMTLTVEGKAARVAVDSAAQHIAGPTDDADPAADWADKCGIPSMRFVVCNVDRATTDGLMFYARSKSFTFSPANEVPGPIWVSTNATYFHFPSIEVDNNLKSISVKTAAPHFLADGTTLNSGNFSAFLPNGILTLWGIEKTESALKEALAASVTKGTTETEVAADFVINDDGVKVKFPKISYSAPVVAVKQKPAVTPTTTVTTTVPVVAPTTPVTVPTGKTLKRGKSVSLVSLIKPVGAGKQTWSSSGGCAIKAKALVAPKKKATCKVTLKQAKSGKVKASTRSVTVRVL